MVDKPTYEELEKRIRELEKDAFDYQQIQIALRDSEERYRMLAEFTYDWETWRGTDGKYIYVSPSCERITGYMPDEFIKDPWLIETPLNIERLALKEIFQVIREEFSPQLSIQEISWSEPDYIPEIEADRLCIIRALRNLVDNALKYGGEALREINIGYKKSRESHILSITDNGIGLKQEGDREDIFTPFIRKKTSKGVQGSGMGLAIVREIAEKHGGDVWLEPGQERGVTFYISIPNHLGGEK